MKNRVLILSGTPGSGKSTLSKLLCKKFSYFKLLKKHKFARDGVMKDEYHNISREDFNDMVKKGMMIQWHERYGNLYGISIQEIENLNMQGFIPIIHPGTHSNLIKIQESLSGSWITYSALLFCNEEQTKRNLRKREGNNEELNKRLKAYEEEVEILKKEVNCKSFQYIVENSKDLTSEHQDKILRKLSDIIIFPPSPFIPKKEIETFLEVHL